MVYFLIDGRPCAKKYYFKKNNFYPMLKHPLNNYILDATFFFEYKIYFKPTLCFTVLFNFLLSPLGFDGLVDSSAVDMYYLHMHSMHESSYMQRLTRLKL
jgi:hypothetical protein